LGPTGPAEWEEGRVGNLAFLSARPHLYKDVSEKKSYAKFELLHEKKGMHALPSMLAGSVTSGSSFMFKVEFAYQIKPFYSLYDNLFFSEYREI